MNSNNIEAKISQTVAVDRIDRWVVYRRLQQLNISCECFTDKPLQVQLNNTKEAIQLWSVVKQIRSNRCELINWLDSCWLLDWNAEE